MKFNVEITVGAEIEAKDLKTLIDKICEEGWTVFSLLDQGAECSEFTIRDELNDVVGIA